MASATGSHEADMDHAQIPVMFKNLIRRDAKTRERAINELYNLLKKIYFSASSKGQSFTIDQKELYSVLLCWSQLYPKLALDISNPIRAVSHKIQALLFSKAFSIFSPTASPSSSSADISKAKSKHKAVLKLVGLVAGTWYSGIFDTDKTVATECKTGFETVFPSSSSPETKKVAKLPKDSTDKPKPSKHDAFFLAFELNILAYISDILNVESSDTLSDARFVPADECVLKYERAQSTCILTLSALIDHKRKVVLTQHSSKPPAGDAYTPLFDESSESYTTFLDIVSAKGFWKLTSSSSGIVSRAFLTSISKIISAIPLYVLEEHPRDIFGAFIKSPLTKADTKTSGQSFTRGFGDVEVIQALTHITKYFPQVWSYKSSSDAKKKDKKEKKKKSTKETESDESLEKKAKKSRSGLEYLVAFLKSGNSQNSPVFWHVVMGLLLSIPQPYSPFPATYEESSDKSLCIESSNIVLEAVASAAKNSQFAKALAFGAIQKPGSKPVLNSAADTWTFYLVLVEKIADQETDARIKSEIISSASKNLSDYLYGSESPATSVVDSSLNSLKDTPNMARQKASNRSTLRELDSTLLAISTRVTEHLWNKYPAEMLSEMDQGFNSVYELLTNDSVTPTHLQAALSNAVKFGYNVLSNLSKQSLKYQQAAVFGLVVIFVNNLVEFYGKIVSDGFFDTKSFDKVTAIGPVIDLVLALYGVDNNHLGLLSDEKLILKFRQLCSVFFSTISSTHSSLPPSIYDTFASIVYKFLSTAKSLSALNKEVIGTQDPENDKCINVDTNQFVLLGVEKVLEQLPPTETLTLYGEEVRTNTFFSTVSMFLKFSNVLSSTPLTDSPKLSEFITKSLVSWLENVSPSSDSPGLFEVSEDAALSVLYSVIYHSLIVAEQDSLTIFTVLVDKLISIEKQFLAGEFDVVIKKNDESIEIEPRAIKIKNTFKWIISQVKTKDTQFLLTYTTTEAGKTAVNELWRLAGERQQVESSEKDASFIESLITQLDFFSNAGEESLALSKEKLDPEVVLKIVKEVKTDVLSSSLLDLDIYIQRAFNIITKLDLQTIGTVADRPLKLEAFENLLFDRNTWDSVLQRVFSYGIPRNACLSQDSDNRGSAYFLIDTAAISNFYGEKYATHFSQDFVEACTQLLGMCMFTATLTLHLPLLFDQSNFDTVFNVLYGFSYSIAIFNLLSECGILQNITNSEYFVSLSTEDLKNARNSSDMDSKTQAQETFIEISKAVQRDAIALLSEKENKLKVDSTKTFEIIASAVSLKDVSVSVAESVNIGPEKPHHHFFAQVWEYTRDLSSPRSFYSFLVLEKLLLDIFTSNCTTDSLIPRANDLKKYIPNRVLNKLGTLAMISSLTHATPKSDIVEQSLSSFRNNLLADIIGGPRSGLHTDKRAIFALAAFAPSLYHTGDTHSGVIFPTAKSSELVGISPFKIANFISRVASTFDEFMEPEYAPLAILLGRVLVGLSSTFLPHDLPSVTFWEPVLEYVTSILTAASSLPGFDDEEDAEHPSDNESRENKWFSNTYLQSGCYVLNSFMAFYNYDTTVDTTDFDASNLKTEEIGDTLRSIHSLLTDTVTVFFDTNRDETAPTKLSLSLSSKVLEYFSQSIKPNTPGSFPYYETEASLFYSLLSHSDPFIQQTALVVVSDELKMNQKDRALEYAAISAPTAEEIEQQLIPVELFSLILSPPAEFNASKSKSESVLKTLLTPNARQYFYTWYIIFQYFELSVYSLRILFLNQLKERDNVLDLMNCISAYFFNLKSGPDSLDITQIDTRSKFYVEDDITQFDTHEHNIDPMKHLLWHLIFQSLNHAGSVVKNWFNGSINLHLRTEFESAVGKYISPLLIQSELSSVRKYAAQEAANNADNDDDDDIGAIGVKRTEINITNNGRLIVVRLHVDTQYMELQFQIPSGYPLQDIRIEGTKRIGANERQWSSWVSLSQVTLFKRLSGSVVTAIELFKRNATLYFEGFSECAICYSVLQDDKTLPTKECRVCHNKFHASCLQQWIKSSSSHACPLCRTEKVF